MNDKFEYKQISEAYSQINEYEEPPAHRYRGPEVAIFNGCDNEITLWSCNELRYTKSNATENNIKYFMQALDEYTHCRLANGSVQVLILNPGSIDRILPKADLENP